MSQGLYFITFTTYFITRNHTMKSLCMHLFSSLKLGKSLKTYVLPTICSPKDSSNALKFSITFFLSVKQSFIRACHSLKSAITQVQQHYKWNMHLSLTRHYTTITSATAFFPAGSCAADQFVYSQLYKFALAPEVPSCCQCRNHLIVP